MLSLKNITKDYPVGDTAVHALRGVSIDFRRSEFVSILGQSGCGKTTLLNIIGGLDRYTDGDLSINGKSTKDFKDADWDSYRNHSIGFVFQSYNLIPHQTVLANVELALTLSGVSKSERRKRATEALEQVGLGDQLNKKPNQMSGGQMQRVAIARALVNDPDILLADEPTGALDTETSVQIMKILKKISKDKLIIMVTHNPELASEYSSRIIKLLDGRVTDDSDPYDAAKDSEAPREKSKEEIKKERKKLKTSMSFWTALGLSRNNLLTKKARTLLTSFAGSIGIIGIALILSISNGVQLYIDGVQSDTLSTYPLQIQESTASITEIMSIMVDTSKDDTPHEEGKIYSLNQMGEMINTMLKETKVNNLTKFKEFLDSDREELDKYTSDIKYGYSTTLNVFRSDTENGIVQVNPSQVFLDMGMMSETDMLSMNAMGSMMSSDVWSEMLDNQELLDSQYDVVAGKMPESYDELAIIVSKHDHIHDYVLYSLGILDSSELTGFMRRAIAGEEIHIDSEQRVFTYDDLLGLSFRLVATPDFYKKTASGWEDMREDDDYMVELLANSQELKIVGILRPSENSAATSIQQGIAYRPELMTYLVNRVNESEIIKEQLADPETDVFTGLKFKSAAEETAEDETDGDEDSSVAADTESSSVEHVNAPDSASAQDVDSQSDRMSISDLTEEQMAALMSGEIPEGMTEDDVAAIRAEYMLSMQGDDSLSDDELTEMGNDALVGLGNGGMLSGGDFMEGLTDAQREFIGSLSDEQMELMMKMVSESAQSYDKTGKYSKSSYENNLLELGYATIEKPNSINIYPKDFASKEKIVEIIDRYNASVSEEDTIEYTDLVGVMMSSVTSIINAISYVLIAFVAISLIVSSIMIGIITYISVLERTKEIGILRSIGASKRDISRVFNAETVIVGFVAGVLGIGLSYLLTIPINAIIAHLTDVGIRASIPVIAAAALVVISVLLTLIAGLLPSRVAAKKDPVIALRTE